jgi:uncharacterized membrane protein YfbV (UPF0208 family)
LFNRGQHYAKTWPLDKRLAPVFIENRIIRATRYPCIGRLSANSAVATAGPSWPPSAICQQRVKMAIARRPGLSTSASRRYLLKTASFVPPATPSASCRRSRHDADGVAGGTNDAVFNKYRREALVERPGLRVVLTLCWQIALGGQLGPAVATALFALSLPMQGLWWLDRRQRLPRLLQFAAYFVEPVKNGRRQRRH